MQFSKLSLAAVFLFAASAMAAPTIDARSPTPLEQAVEAAIASGTPVTTGSRGAKCMAFYIERMGPYYAC